MRDEGGRSANGGEMSWSVGGMDCAACVAKVRRSVEGLPGISDVRVSLISENLALRLDPALATPDAVESIVRRLGYATRSPQPWSRPPRRRAYPSSRRAPVRPRLGAG
jgi:Cd2+/Zn2+-exporting ATPase